MIEWLGPIVVEYYAGDRGRRHVRSRRRTGCKKPGTRRQAPTAGRTIDDPATSDGNDVAAGRRSARVCLQGAGGAGRSSTTRTRRRPRPPTAATTSRSATSAISTSDGYLFLTGRSAEPHHLGRREHLSRRDRRRAARAPRRRRRRRDRRAQRGVGRRGEGRRRARSPASSRSPELGDELIAFCRERLAHFKCPRSVDFVNDLPRSDAGKVYRRLVREPLLEGARPLD